MLGKTPIEKLGLVSNGKIYIRANKPMIKNNCEIIEFENLHIIINPLEDIAQDEYSWVEVIRAWKKPNWKEGENEK